LRSLSESSQSIFNEAALYNQNDSVPEHSLLPNLNLLNFT
jgi:hypothetical protein